MTINYEKKTIEMTKKFAKEASKFGTTEYKALQEARHDYPDFKVETKASKGKKQQYDGLTYEYMEKYIKAHDNAESNMAEFKLMRGMTKEAGAELAMSFEYADIKEWFLQTYPEIEKYSKKRDELLNKIRQQKEQRQEAAKKAA